MGILFLTWIVGVGVGGSPGETFFTLSALRHSLCVVHTGGGLGVGQRARTPGPAPPRECGELQGHAADVHYSQRRGCTLFETPGLGWGRVAGHVQRKSKILNLDPTSFSQGRGRWGERDLLWVDLARKCCGELRVATLVPHKKYLPTR
uniref:Secreted protein n=1 Tax=Cacopsylla melanoneura TaxID=428564 RepID=A0A8D8XFR7_9HEMI